MVASARLFMQAAPQILDTATVPNKCVLGNVQADTDLRPRIFESPPELIDKYLCMIALRGDLIEKKIEQHLPA